MFAFLRQPEYKPAETGPAADTRYRRMRWQVFLGAFIGYAGFYLVRKNLSMAIPEMEPLGFAKAELGFVLGLNAAGTAAGLTGFFGYFLGTFILANWVIGWVAEAAGWSWTFLLLVAACCLSIVFMALTCGQERGGKTA